MSKKKAYMVVGCPGSGKSWVCNQVKNGFDFVHHDAFIGMQGNAYVQEILKRSNTATKPLLIETPFSMSKIRDPLIQKGIQVVPVYIQEPHQVIKDRYETRDKKPIPQGHLTRQETYLQRAKEERSFHGTTQQCVDYLNNIKQSSGNEES